MVSELIKHLAEHHGQEFAISLLNFITMVKFFTAIFAICSAYILFLSLKLIKQKVEERKIQKGEING